MGLQDPVFDVYTVNKEENFRFSQILNKVAWQLPARKTHISTHLRVCLFNLPALSHRKNP